MGGSATRRETSAHNPVLILNDEAEDSRKASHITAWMEKDRHCRDREVQGAGALENFSVVNAVRVNASFPRILKTGSTSLVEKKFVEC